MLRTACAVIRRSQASQETQRAEVDAENRAQMLAQRVHRAEDGAVAAEHEDQLAGFAEDRPRGGRQPISPSRAAVAWSSRDGNAAPGEFLAQGDGQRAPRPFFCGCATRPIIFADMPGIPCCLRCRESASP